MSDGFETMVDAAQRFFGELRDNNEKAWFEAHKAHFVEDIRKPVELLSELLAEDLSRLTGLSQSAKVFRIYRDVRFSKDKTPYKVNQHMLWRSTQDAAPAWFFAIEIDRLWFGMGLVGMNPAMLTRYRQFIDRDGAEFTKTLSELEKSHGTALSTYGPEPLKRVPKPFDPDHEFGDLLRRKGMVLGSELPATWRQDGLVKAVRQMAEAHLPIWRLMADGI